MARPTRREPNPALNRNSLPVSGGQPFGLDQWDDDARGLPGHAGAPQARPIDRLRPTIPPAIELYRRCEIDIAAELQEFAMNSQHMNGGIAVDTWHCSSLRGCCAVGGTAGTPRVTRPGGAALNVGQVFGGRAAEPIVAGVLRSDSPPGFPSVRVERATDREGRIVIRAEGRASSVTTRPDRSIDETAKPVLERDGTDWLTGRIFDLDPS